MNSRQRLACAWMMLVALACGGLMPARLWGQSAAPAPAPAPTPAVTPVGPIDLRPRFVAGQSLRYAVWTARDQVVTRAGEQVVTRFEIDGEVDWQVDRVKADGSASCTMTMLWLTAKITGPDGQTEFNDTRQGSGQTEPVYRLLSAMAGVPLQVEVSAEGTPTSVGGVDAVRRRAGDLPVPEDLDFLETATDLATLPYAPAAANPGQKWNAAFTWTHDMGAMQHDTGYQLVQVESIAQIPVAMISVNSRLRLQVDRSKLPSEGPQIDVQLLQGTVEGQIMFDLDRREAVGRNTVQNQTVQITVSLEGQRFVQTIAETIHSQALRIREQ